ncbi:MAG: GNAT family N-acetyltransferase [Chloroflexota bacterium]
MRPAQREDLDVVLALIKGLADYERLSHEVVITAESLREHLFGERRYCECLLAEEPDGSVAGFALFFHTYSTFLGQPGIYLEDLFVWPERRGRGHGKALLASLGKLALERGCGRLEWLVLNWNEPSIQFYRSLGAEALDGWTKNRVSGEALTALADLAPDS